MIGTWSQTRLCLEAHVDSDIECAQWCANTGLLQAMKPCTVHDQDRALVCRSRNNNDQLFWRCSKCSDQISARTGSIFDKVHLPLGKSLLLIMCFAHGLSIGDAIWSLIWTADCQPIAQTTAVRFYERVRARVAASGQANGRIGGPGQIVQIDEALIGRRKYHRGRTVQGTWVLGMIDADGSTRFEIIKNRKAVTLEAAIQRHVAPGSIVHTDEWRAYSRLSALGHSHATVNHSERFVSPEGVHTQRIESQWRQIRRKFSKGGIRHCDIKDHLAEYVWRRACRLNGIDLFRSLIEILRV